MIILRKTVRPSNKEWKINILETDRPEGSVKIIGTVLHVRSGKTSAKFTIVADKFNQHIHVGTPGYSWDGTVPFEYTDSPMLIVEKTLKIAIMAGVMFQVSCRPTNQHSKMNAFLGSRVYSKQEAKSG